MPEERPEERREERMLFTPAQIRAAMIGTVVVMLAVPTVLLLLMSARPQGQLRAADDSAYRAHVRAAAENLEGFELVGETRARIDIRRAIELVAERGVDLPLVAVSAEVGDDDGVDAAADGPAEADGGAVYGAQCAACHQANGQGVPGAFPPLAGEHLVALAGSDDGRAYLVRALLYGVQGPLTIAGTTYDGMMPAFPQLSDDEVAAVLNHLTVAFGNDDLHDGLPAFTADDVDAARGEGLTGPEVLDLRPDVD